MPGSWYALSSTRVASCNGHKDYNDQSILLAQLNPGYWALEASGRTCVDALGDLLIILSLMQRETNNLDTNYEREVRRSLEDSEAGLIGALPGSQVAGGQQSIPRGLWKREGKSHSTEMWRSDINSPPSVSLGIPHSQAFGSTDGPSRTGTQKGKREMSSSLLCLSPSQDNKHMLSTEFKEEHTSALKISDSLRRSC